MAIWYRPRVPRTPSPGRAWRDGESVVGGCRGVCSFHVPSMTRMIDCAWCPGVIQQTIRRDERRLADGAHRTNIRLYGLAELFDSIGWEVRTGQLDPRDLIRRSAVALASEFGRTIDATR